ncbi:sensor histidine kinase [Streptomyces sp. A5-4]|uniref:sensor histidine kinase n=1 Tax=Streptomyces sp. A5-4 TaxID=3384771 RepID=UPI003DA99CD6
MSAHTHLAQRRTERPHLRPAATALLLSVAVTALLFVWAVAVAPDRAQVPLAWGAGAAAVALSAAVTVATYALGSVRLLRERIAGTEADSDRFADRTVPALVTRLREGASAATALAATPLPASDDGAARRVLATLAQEVARGESSRSAAMSACANAAGRMQALATSMAADLREMEHRHTDESVLGDLMHLDHRTAQAGRLADSVAVLTGARSGRRWAKPIVMESILRGAMGRISGYQRVRLHSTSEVAVAGHAAEGVMHALAELLDNAANFSPPTAEVHVYVEEVPAGIIITVEDSGLVMSDVQLRRAERAVSAAALDLTTLSGTRLGLAVVGCLARKHGLTVSFRPSARGGTGALMMLPQELVARPRPEVDPAPEPVPAPAARPPATTAEAAQAPGQPSTPARPATESPAPASASASPSAETTAGLPQFGDSGLPKRRRGRTLAATHAETPQVRTPGTTPASPPPDQTARAERFSTFRRAVQGRSASPSSSHPEGNTP